MVCETFGNYVPEAGSPNVGTILFNRDDLNNRQWSKAKINLLQTRKYFQNLIPSPHLLRTVNENYLDYLLTYYQDSYNTVKREVKNIRLKKMVDVALSDALGGYLKVWILPITKYAYYGGSVSMEKAVNIFQVYDKIKRSLNTDGHNWRNPNENLLRSVAVDIVSRPRPTFTRSMENPCKLLSLYEKTDSDLKIPLPIVNWDVQPATLLLPLKDKSFTSLDSPNSSQIVLQYFDIAENCIKSQNVQNLDDFNKRFQVWLSNNIMPHLNDDNLYLPFGSILTLANTTKQFYGKICTSYKDKCKKLQSKAEILGLPQQVSLKKYIIITIILLIEIIWCVPSLFYLMRLKKKKKTTKEKKPFFRFFKKKLTFNMQKMSQYNFENNNFQGPRKDLGTKVFVEPKARNLEVALQFPSHESKYTVGKRSKATHSNASCKELKLAREIPETCPLKQEFASTSPFNDETNCQCYEVCENIISSITPSLNRKMGRTSELKDCRTSTMINKRTIKEVLYAQNSSVKKSISTLETKCGKNNEIILQKTSVRIPCLEEKNKENKIKTNTNTESKTKSLRTKHNDNKYGNKYVKQQVDQNSETKKPKTNETNIFKINNERIQYSKLNGDTRILRIKIDKPTKIRVGITNVKEVAGSSRKPSKIPRLAVKNSVKEALRNINKPINIKPSPKITNIKLNSPRMQKTNLKIKQNALDDSAIKRTSKVAKKINVTL
ncbi:unnamed protein product, partial [Brenthis ino]